MPRTKKSTPAASVPPDPFDPTEAAGRLNVVLQILEAHSIDCPARAWNTKDTGGYELSIMRDVLVEVRDSLWKAGRS